MCLQIQILRTGENKTEGIVPPSYPPFVCYLQEKASGREGGPADRE